MLRRSHDRMPLSVSINSVALAAAAQRRMIALLVSTSRSPATCLCLQGAKQRSQPLSAQPVRCFSSNSSHCATSADPSEFLRWPNKTSPNPYQIFHINRGEVDQKVLKKRYYILVKQYHPDTAELSDTASDAAKAADKIIRERFNRIVEAYNVLSDPARKRLYDVSGDGWNYPDPERPPVKPHERYNYTAEEWERMKNFTYETMWASGRYPDRDGRPPPPPKPKPIDHEANIRTLMWIVLFTGVVTYIQSLRVMTWSDKYDEAVKQNYLQRATTTSRIFGKYSGSHEVSDMVYQDKGAHVEPTSSPPKKGVFVVPENPLPKLREIRTSMRSRAVAAGMDPKLPEYKKMDDALVLSIGKAISNGEEASKVIAMAQQMSDDFVRMHIDKPRKER
ncbi:hypothetical protein V1517DRAFT_313690 [Lipomyces orientalis]|uniref:Uncharacterized protein n=1 Tax=Lipomyces orientalis TaxID=1233043 RepID=A0ACC3TWJ2_9ASCO